MSETVDQEADRLIVSDRDEAYGAAPATAERFAAIGSAVTGLEILPEHYPLLMIAAKLARQANAYKRDNLVDIVGYARIAEEIHAAGTDPP